MLNRLHTQAATPHHVASTPLLRGITVAFARQHSTLTAAISTKRPSQHGTENSAQASRTLLYICTRGLVLYSRAPRPTDAGWITQVLRGMAFPGSPVLCAPSRHGTPVMALPGAFPCACACMPTKGHLRSRTYEHARQHGTQAAASLTSHARRRRRRR